MKRQQQKSAKSVAFLTLPLTEQPRMQSLFIPCFSFFFTSLSLTTIELKFPLLQYWYFISSSKSVVFFIFANIRCTYVCTFIRIGAHQNICMQYTRAEVKLVKRITVLSWQPLIKDHLNNRRPTARISHSHPRHSASSSFTTALLSFPQLLSVEMCTERKYEILFENTIYELLEMEAIF